MKISERTSPSEFLKQDLQFLEECVENFQVRCAKEIELQHLSGQVDLVKWEKCKQLFNGKEKLEYHVKGWYFKCTNIECTNIFYTKAELQAHKNTMHIFKSKDDDLVDFEKKLAMEAAFKWESGILEVHDIPAPKDILVPPSPKNISVAHMLKTKQPRENQEHE